MIHQQDLFGAPAAPVEIPAAPDAEGYWPFAPGDVPVAGRCYRHNGGARPVAADVRVIVKHRNGDTGPALPAGARRWEPFPPHIRFDRYDIIGWKLA